MKVLQLFFLAQVILVPIILYLFRFNKIGHRYLPLFFYLLVKEVTEIISWVLVYFFKARNAIPYNLMYLSEALLITWLFYNLKVKKSGKQLYSALSLVWVLIWILDVCLIGSIHKFNFAFRLSYCFTLLFVAAALTGSIAFSSKRNLFKEANFLICIAFIFWFAYNIVYEGSFLLFKISNDFKPLAGAMTTYIAIAEVVVYLVFAWAIWCIPAKRTGSNVSKYFQ